MDKRIKQISWLCCSLVLLGLSTTARADNTRDPYQGYNRAMFRFNEAADRYVMAPVARAYRTVTPKPARTAIGNFFNNLRDVHSLGSNLLRGNIKNAGIDLMRVAINTTFGLGGLIDIAGEAQMPNNKNTLGDTFASWGWKNSNYVVLPFLGPTTVRDALGTGIHTAYSINGVVMPKDAVRYPAAVVDGIDQRERLLDATDTLEEVSLDKYTMMRDTYIAMRNKQLGITPPESEEETLTDPEADWQDNTAAASAPPQRHRSSLMYEVNRSVFIVIPREPFWYWLNELPDSDLGGLNLIDLQEDANSYLVDACENADELWDIIEERVEEIFAAELADWCADETHWPDLHLDIFREWFDVELSSIVTDLSSEPLQRESFQEIYC